MRMHSFRIVVFYNFKLLAFYHFIVCVFVTFVSYKEIDEKDKCT